MRLEREEFLIMKRTLKLASAFLIVASLFIAGVTTAYAADSDKGYDPNKAIAYAIEHWDDKTAYDGGTVDCVKFVKSCVEAGGVPIEEGRTWGYNPVDYVNYILDNGYADKYELTLTPHSWNSNRFYVSSYLNEGKISTGDILVYSCTFKGCEKPCFHLELVGDADGIVKSYAHNTAKNNVDVITYPHKKCKAKGATDSNTKISVLHFKEDLVFPCQHKYGTYKVLDADDKAGFDKTGLSTATCSLCGESKTKVIPAVKTPTLSTTAYTYNGKAKKPIVTVKDTAGTSIAKSVTYAKGRISVGKYAVTVKLNSAKYSGTKTVYFKINPKGTSVSKLTAAKKGFTVKWAKQSAKMSSSRITGYQYRYSTSSKMTSAKTMTVAGYSKTSAKKTGLIAKKNYYVQVRTYKTVNGVKYYSAWSKYKKVKTK